MSGNHVNVLIVDDSAVVRQVLTAVLEQDPGICVVGAAPELVGMITALRVARCIWPLGLSGSESSTNAARSPTFRMT